MSQEDFESFYRGTRSDVLLGAFLLTGDLTAATTATRDAYAIAWQHWKKLAERRASGTDATASVRSNAWKLAARRHTGRIWHRNKGLSEAERDILDGLHQLPPAQRRALILVDVAGVELAAAGRELSLTAVATATRLEESRAAVREHLGPDYVARLSSLKSVASASRLPRAPVLMRAGRKRQRVQAVVAVMAAVALTVGAGAAAYEPVAPERTPSAGGRPTPTPLPEGVTPTSPGQLLDGADLATLGRGRDWEVRRTSANTRGDGINVICQQSRYADPAGVGGLIRTYRAEGRLPARALQTVEISQDEAAAEAAYDTTVSWFARCTEPRIQLVAAYDVTGVGDQAGLLRLRLPGTPARTYDVATARAGEVTTLMAIESSARLPQPRNLGRTLGTALDGVCPVDREPCTKRVRVTPAAPPRAGEEPGFLAALDLPPLDAVPRPWVGIDSINALREADTPTRCGQVNYRRTEARSARSRTYLIPGARLPETFGLTETYAVFANPRRARAFLAGVRTDVAGCEDRDLTTDVSTETRSTTKAWDLSVWRVENTIDEDRTVAFRIGFARVGRVVAKVTFVAAPRADLSAAEFESLVKRAAQRLRDVPSRR